MMFRAFNQVRRKSSSKQSKVPSRRHSLKPQPSKSPSPTPSKGTREGEKVLSDKSTALGSEKSENPKDFGNPSLTMIQNQIAAKLEEFSKELKFMENFGSFKQNQGGSRSAPVSPKTQQIELELNSFSKYQENHQKIINQRSSLPPRVGGLEFIKLAFKNIRGVKIQEYFHRLFEFGEFSDQVAILAFIYIKRALSTKRALRAEHLHKLTAGCVRLAQKYLSETLVWGAEEYGYLIGFPSKKVKIIENEVLFNVLSFELYVSEEEYEGVLEELTFTCF